MFSKIMLSLFDRRFVYIMRCQNLFKIGISTNVERRSREVQRTVRAALKNDKIKVKILLKLRFFRAGKFESKIHKKFKSIRVDFVGSGKSEYFKLTFFNLSTLIFKMYFLYCSQVLALVVSFLMIVLLISKVI